MTFLAFRKICLKTVAMAVLAAIAVNAVPACGPGYVSPVFDNLRAPETPFSDFASGRLGIVKPTYRRDVLFAAYRYLNGGGFSDWEQRALLDYWNGAINNRSVDNDQALTEAVKAWVEQRKSIVGSEAKTPEIYVERAWGGYDFFPNCTKNAFETAARTLSDRAASHGSSDKDVVTWLKTQDQVFRNCSDGRSIPSEPAADMADWLKKDRAYQIAAAEFYALDYQSARRRFAAIAQDSESPWQETAEYLIGRTLIREASLSGGNAKAEALYYEADQALQNVAMKRGKFSDDAERLLGVVKYRLRPADRLRELSQKIAVQSDQNFKQDIIDYNWLIDKYEKETLEKEEKRKAEIEARNNPPESPAPVESPTPERRDDILTIYIYIEETQTSYTVEIPVNATDDEAIAAAERVVGRQLNENLRQSVRSQRQSAYASRFTDRIESGYQGGYWGSETMTVEMLPEILRQDEMTEWIFAFRIESPDAFDHAVSRWRASGSELWLMTALVKAVPTSSGLDRLIEEGQKISSNSAAFATVMYHLARLEIARGRLKEAKSLLDELIASPTAFPPSTRNQFLRMRMTLSDNLDDFLRSALRKPYAFDFDGQIGTLDEHLAEQKSWWSPDAFPDQTREQYEKELEKKFAQYRRYSDESMFDDDALGALNRYFTTEELIKVERSELLPKHMHQRLAIAIWTRALLLDNDAAARQITPRLLEAFPEWTSQFAPYLQAATPIARKRAALAILLKNPILTPYIDSGFDANNEFDEWDSDNWWCGWVFDSENEDPSTTPSAPRFLTGAQTTAAKTERTKLAAIGDAPKYFSEKTLEWARVAPADKRVPEMLYIAWSSNGWTKYGCGEGPEAQDAIAKVMRAKYPTSPWTKKLDENPEQ